MKVSIYTAYHRSAPRIQSASIQPIHVGRAKAEAPLPEMTGDDSGDNLSARNQEWCELTALYWAWKNDRDSDAIGLMHYRRLLDLTDLLPGGAVERTPGRLHIPDWTAQVEAWLEREGANWDIVLPRAHEMGRSVEENYRNSHQDQDFDLAREIVMRDHPEYASSFEAVASGHKVRLGNLALMKRPLFERYCVWLFDILFKVEDAGKSRQYYSGYQTRYLGFLAERLLTVFVHHLQATAPDLRIRDVSILALSQTLVTPYLVREDLGDADNSVNIAFSADRTYLPHTAAMLRSLVDHADATRTINLFFLCSGIGAQDLDLLGEVLARHEGVTLHPIETGGAFEASYRSMSRAPSNATYNRFLLFDLLPCLDRLVYLDTDLILRADVCELYDTDIGQAEIAAVPDWIMTRTLTGPTKTIDRDVPDLSEYHRNVLKLSEAEIERYFNAGVLVFNFAAMADVAETGRALLLEARQGKYLFRDQDILNKHFKNTVFQLDPRWNVFNSFPTAYDRVPAPGRKAALAAKQDPWIIHYADQTYKPWQFKAIPMAQHYWQALMRTPFYGEVMSGTGARSRLSASGFVVRAGKALAERVPVLRRPLLKLYAGLKRSGR